jgi:hypothetical protein
MLLNSDGCASDASGAAKKGTTAADDEASTARRVLICRALQKDRRKK